MTPKQKETYENLLKIPNIHKPQRPHDRPNYGEEVYLNIIGVTERGHIKIHRSGDFSFVFRVNKKYRYIKNIDSFMNKLFKSTQVGLAYHFDLLYDGSKK